MSKTHWVNGEPFDSKSPEERARIKEERRQEKLDKKKRVAGEIPRYIKGGKMGMDLERRVAKKWNDASSGPAKKKKFNVDQRLSMDEDEPVDESATSFSSIELPKTFSAEVPKSSIRTGFSTKAKRQPNSGAMWHAKGDITLSHALVEVKERGSVNSRGEKSISIPKEWLTKQADEAFQERRPYWYIAFAYKGDEEVYLIKPYDHEIEIVQRLEELELENIKLKQDILDLKNK